MEKMKQQPCLSEEYTVNDRKALIFLAHARGSKNQLAALPPISRFCITKPYPYRGKSGGLGSVEWPSL
jgi:hypothetical protein